MKLPKLLRLSSSRRLTHVRTRRERVLGFLRGVQLRALSVVAVLAVVAVSLPHVLSVANADTPVTLKSYFSAAGDALSTYAPANAQYLSFPADYGAACTVDPDLASITFGTHYAWWLGRDLPDCEMEVNPNFGPVSEAFFGSSADAAYPAIYTAAGATITFNSPQKYLGFWWTAGSGGNKIDFYSGDQLMATTDADTLYGIMTDPDATRTCHWAIPEARTEFQAYFGNPDPLAIDESTGNRLDGCEPFVYINYFAQPGTTFDKVVLSTTGNGFEFANMAISQEELTPTGSMTELQSFHAPIYQATYDSNGGLGSLSPTATDDPSLAKVKGAYDASGGVDGPTNYDAGESPPYLVSWNTMPDGTGDEYLPDDSIPANTPLKLYAQWGYQFRLYNDPNNDGWDTSSDLGYSYVTLIRNNLELRDPVLDLGLTPPEGKIFDGWYAYSPLTYTFDRLGGSGETVVRDVYSIYAYNNVLYARWIADPGPGPGPTEVATLAGPGVGTTSSLPVDPRAKSMTLPTMSLVYSGVDVSAHVCLDEVDADHNTVVGSDMSFTPNDSEVTTEFTGVIATAATALKSRYVRVKIAATGDAGCLGTTNDYFFQLKPMSLSGQHNLQVNLR